MEFFLCLLGMAFFLWMVGDGPQNLMSEWRRGQEAKRDAARAELDRERNQHNTPPH